VVALIMLGLGLMATRFRTSARPASPAAPATPPADAEELRLTRAVESTPEDAAARVALGSYYEGRNRPFEAMWEYAEARRLVPTDAAVAVRTAAVLRDGGILDRARAELLEVTKARPELDALRRLADLYLACAEPEAARDALEARRGSVWSDVAATITLGRARRAAGDEEGALAAFQRALTLDRNSSEAWYRLGRVHLAARRYAEARDGFFHAMVSDPARPEYRLYAGISYLEQAEPGDMDRAISFFQEALAKQPRYGPAHYSYGKALERQGKRLEATTQYSYAILADTSYAEPNLALGRALIAAGDPAEGHRYLGRYYDLKDRPADAVREFRIVQAAAPKSAQASLLLGQVYIRTQQNAEAVSTTEAALKKLPDDPQILERLAVLKINRGDRPYARRLLSHWLKLNPKAASAYWLLGRCEMGDIQFAKAVTYLEKAIALEPKNAHFYGFLGGALARMTTPGSRERAAEALAQAVALAPENAEYRDLYGQTLTKLGRLEEARKQFLRALNADPLRISCFTPVTQLAWRLKRPGPGAFFPTVTRAVQQRLSEESLLWPHVWQHPEDAVGRVKLARFFCRHADLIRARDQLEQAVAQRPDLREARELLARVQRSLEVL
jgi:tetratricopeptide (TPR) repeat protein